MRPLAAFLLLHLYVSTRALYPFGTNSGDQVLEASGWYGSVLDIPVVYYEKSYNEVFVSNNGIVLFGEKMDDVVLPLQQLNHSAVAVYYAAASGGKTYFRTTSSDRQLLKKVSDDVRAAFADDQEFYALQVSLITWENIVNKEGQSGNTYQLTLATDGVVTYALMDYKTLSWASSEGRFAQCGFARSNGRFHTNINSGTDTIVDLPNLSNTDHQGRFAFRVSGNVLEEPRDDYAYNDYKDYDNEAKHAGDDCPPDPYRDNCPVGCNVLTDDRGCSLCVCAEPHPPQVVEIPHNNVEEELPEPPVSREMESDLHPLDPRNREYQHGSDGGLQPAQTGDRAANEVDVPADAEQIEVGTCRPDSCNSNARCQDYPPGYCCACNSGFYGNGKECLKKGEPQRITGTFEGVINGERIERTDLHTFVTGTDGNAYTAVSRVPAGLGPSLLLLSPVGSVMGWLFSEVNSHLVYNGFQLTGGLFNRTATVHIGDTSVVTVRQHFTGRDQYDYFKAAVFVTGTLPHLQENAEVTIADYDEEYRREGPGFVRSYSNMDVTINEGGARRRLKMTVDQQIHYSECAFKEFDRTGVVTLNVKRLHVTYDKVDGIVRYASRNFADTKRTTGVDPRQEQTWSHGRNPLIERQSEDVCAPGRHVCNLPNMKCRAVEHSYRCECVPGFQAKHDTTSAIGWLCVDIDECTRGDHSCDAQAECKNTDGGFECVCKPGFTGDGHYCLGAGAQADLPQQQPPHVHGHHGHPDRVAQEQPAAPPPKGSCTAHSHCHQWGECVFTPGSPNGYCKCRGWYTGDGVDHCGPPAEPSRPEAAPRPEPRREEVQRQDQQQRQEQRFNANIPQQSGHPCGNHICDTNAECLPSPDGGSECVCRAGYHGNGLQCDSHLEEEERPVQVAVVGTVCRSHEECSEHGSCAYNQAVGYYQCTCTPPYKGDGVRCALEEEELVPYNRVEPPQQPAQPAQPAVPPQRPPVHPGCERCDQNAQCVFDSHNRRYMCECASGFIGDGSNCVRLGGGAAPWERPAGPKRCREQGDCHQNGHCVQDERNDYVCQCLPGFRGDGVTTCRIADQCTPADPRSCAQNAECVYGETESAYVCKCVQGFTGDGAQCRPHAPATTCERNPRLCHHNAQCVYNHERQEYGCLCKPGSQGDGYSRCDAVDTPRCTNCSTNANCVASGTGGWRCQCAAGFVGNGYVCAPLTTCLDDRSICDKHAECVPGEGGHYVCNCRYGFHGNGRTCTPDSDFRTDTLLVARGIAIFHRGTHQDIPGKQLIVVPHHIPVGVDFDCQEERIVWSDVSGHSIRTATLQGTNMTSHYRDELQSPEGIAVDWSSRNVYYADSTKDEIGVVSLDGRYQKAIVTEGLVNPRALAIDLNNRHLYYTDWHRENPIIGRVDLDGRNNIKFVQEDVHLPNGLTILQNRRELCWVDAGVKRLSCIGLDGSNRRTVHTGLNYPFGLSHIKEERFYWTDWKDSRVHSVGVYGDGYQSMPISMGGSGKAYGIVGVPDKCHGAPTTCALNNGGCAYLCLPSTETSVHCACPDNVEGLDGC